MIPRIKRARWAYNWGGWAVDLDDHPLTLRVSPITGEIVPPPNPDRWR